MKYSFILAAFIGITMSSCAQKAKPYHFAHPSNKELSKFSQATFASGCFWCVEAVYESVKGVAEVVSGYAGGTKKNPTYEEVGSHATGHAESINVYYDPAVVSYETLLKVYFASQDPTQVNGQGPDLGTPYRSILFFRNNGEKLAAEKYIATIKGKYREPIAAEIKAFEKFWPAEDYHQNYVELNPNVPYVQHESLPRIRRFQKLHPDLLKPDHKF